MSVSVIYGAQPIAPLECPCGRARRSPKEFYEASYFGYGYSAMPAFVTYRHEEGPCTWAPSWEFGWPRPIWRRTS